MVGESPRPHQNLGSVSEKFSDCLQISLDYKMNHRCKNNKFSVIQTNINICDYWNKIFEEQQRNSTKSNETIEVCEFTFKLICIDLVWKY